MLKNYVYFQTELKITRDRAEEAESDLRKCGEVLLKLQAQTLELKKDAEIQRKLAQERSLVANEEIIQTTAEAIEERYGNRISYTSLILILTFFDRTFKPDQHCKSRIWKK